MASMNLLSRASSFVLLTALIAFWEIFARYILPTFEPSAQLLLPPPSRGVHDAFELMQQGALWQHVAASAKRVYIGSGVAALIAIPLGVTMGLLGILHRQLNPLVGVLRPIPPVAWIPITLLWFGVNDVQQYFIIFVGTFFPMLLNTIAGVHDIDPLIRRAALSLGARPHNLFTLTLHAALPNIFLGIRTSLALGWFIIIASEMVSASTGLGFLIIEARTAMITERLYVGMFAIGMIGFLQDQILLFLRKRLIPWA